VQWAALRPSTGERFDMLAAPELLLAPSTPFHTELPEPLLRGADPRRELLAAFARFLRPTDVVGSWGHFAPDLFRAAGGSLPELVDLRAVAQRLVQRRTGSLDDFARSIGPVMPPLARGRAGRRLAALGQLVAAWRAL
jgi:hypothetical protein